MHNLVKSPNIMSTLLYRADIAYDSDHDSALLLDRGIKVDDVSFHKSVFVRGLKANYRPRMLDDCAFKEYTWQRTVVRTLVPRNVQLDKSLLQTCHHFRHEIGDKSEEVIVYIPHVDTAEDMPWYHPRVMALAISYSTSADDIDESSTKLEDSIATPAVLSTQISPFGSVPLTALEPRLSRTCLKMLSTIERHGRGHAAGYRKRVHHDRLVPQKAFQDTFSRLKQTYAKDVTSKWVEMTDPLKHVFEDLSIAAFLIELWKTMYDMSSCNGEHARSGFQPSQQLPPFPGFVDIGCGNGLLVYLLLSEGCNGWGFDARRRKTWSTFPDEIRTKIKEMILVPSVLRDSDDERLQAQNVHCGNFDQGKGTFIISNHADELTAWTPLLARMNRSSFIAIPCCSHDLAGQRFRAPERTRLQTEAYKEQKNRGSQIGVLHAESTSQSDLDNSKDTQIGGAAVGMERPKSSAQPQRPPQRPLSAYSTLCSYVNSLAVEVGYSSVETEALRIPSTRNTCIVGRFDNISDHTTNEECRARLSQLVSREMGMPIETIAQTWLDRAQSLLGKKGDGH